MSGPTQRGQGEQDGARPVAWSRIAVAVALGHAVDQSRRGELHGATAEAQVISAPLEIHWRSLRAIGVPQRGCGDVDALRASGVMLTIEAGTDVRAFGDGTLLVTRGSKLIAEGTASAPITFSSLDDNYDGLGEWGGVVIPPAGVHWERL